MTVNPLHGNVNKIFMIAVLRDSDKTVVAVYATSPETTKEGIRECVAGNAALRSGKRYTSQGESQAIHYTVNAQGRVYAIVTSPQYPARIVFAALDDVQTEFEKEFGNRIASSPEEGLNKLSRTLLKSVVDKYANPAAGDKLQEVQGKIDVVTSAMKDNIQQLLLNEEKLERIETATVQLNEQSMQFKSNSKQLSDKMWWKMWKMRLLIGGLIIVVLIIIIVPSVMASNSSNSSN